MMTIDELVDLARKSFLASAEHLLAAWDEAGGEQWPGPGIAQAASESWYDGEALLGRLRNQHACYDSLSLAYTFLADVLHFAEHGEEAVHGKSWPEAMAVLRLIAEDLRAGRPIAELPDPWQAARACVRFGDSGTRGDEQRPSIRTFSLVDAVAAAQAECERRGWPWQAPTSVRAGRRGYSICLPAQPPGVRGGMIIVEVDGTDGSILDARCDGR